MKRVALAVLLAALPAPLLAQTPVRVTNNPDPATETTLAAIAGYVDQLEGYLDGLEGYLGTIAGAISGSEMQVDIVAGGPTEYTEDDAAAANPTGIMPVMVRADSASTIATTDGDVVAQRITNYGAAFVSLRAAHNGTPAYIEAAIPNGGSGETALFVSPKSNQTDDGAFSVATDAVDGIAALADETSPDSVNEGDVGIVRMTLDRKLLTRLVGSTDANRAEVDGSGNLQVDLAASSATVTVDGSGVTQPVSAASLPLPTGAATEDSVDGIEGLLGTIDADTSTLAGAVSGSEVQVDVVAPLPAGSNEIGGVDVTKVGGATAHLDPCQREAKIRVSISQTSGTQLIAGTASERIYICSLHLVTATAQNIALVSGTGTTCGTSTSGVEGFGGSTAATGWNFAANGGIALAASGFAYGNTDTDQDNVCLLQSGSGQISGGLTYVSASSGL